MTEVQLLERFSWTFQQLDEADIPRLFHGVYAANILDGLKRLMRWMADPKHNQPSERDWELWNWVQEQVAEHEAEQASE